jgi:tetratricopeptide (TPR) repeat protein
VIPEALLVSARSRIGLSIHISLIALLICFIAPVAHAEDNQSVFKLGERFFNDSIYNLALEQYQKYITLKRSPENDATVYYRIGLCLYKMKNMQKAAESLAEYLRLFPSDDNVMNALVFAASAHKALGENKEASELYYMVWNRFVGSAQAQRSLYESAACAEKDGSNDRAIELYEIFYRKFPKHDKLRQVSLALIRLLIEQKEYGKAADVLKEAESRWGSEKDFKVRLLYQKARLARCMQKAEESAKNFSAMLKTNETGFPEFEQACFDYIDLLTDRQDYAGSLAVYQLLGNYYKKKSTATPWRVLSAWADAARLSKSFTQAEDLYSQLLHVAPDSVSESLVLYQMAECQIGKGDVTRAVETLQGLVSRDSLGPSGIKALQRIGDLYYDNKLYLSAIAAYQRYLSLPEQPNNDALVFRIGTIYQDKFNHYGTALREYENLVKRYPASPFRNQALFAIGECSEALGDYQSAVRQYGYFVELGTQDPLLDSARNRIAYLTAYRIKNTETAVRNLTELLRRGTDTLTKADKLFSLAHIYSEDLKDYEGANTIYDDLRAVNPPLPDSLQADIAYHVAFNNERLWEKAEYEKNNQLADYSRTQALSLYKQVVEKYASSAWADDAAFRYMKMTKPNIAEYEQFVKTYGSSQHLPEVLFDIASHYERRALAGDAQFSKKAIEAYAGLVTRFPASAQVPRALLGLAQNYLMQGNLDSSMAAVKELNRRFPASEYVPDALFYQGRVFRLKGQFAEAIEAFKQILFQYPFASLASQARFELAQAQFETGKIFDASSNFGMYLQTNPQGDYNRPARFGIARCQVKAGNFTDAQRKLQDLLDDKKLPDSLQAAIEFELAQVMEKQNDVFKALTYYNSVLKRESFPQKGNVFLHVGALDFDNRLYDDAVVAYEKALENVRTVHDTMQALKGNITALIMAGKGKDAEKKIAAFNELFGDSIDQTAEIVYYDGLYMVVEKQYDKALNRFKYILAKYDETPWVDDAAYQIALVYYYDGKKDQALQQFSDFCTQYPQSEYVPLAHFKIGMVYHEQNDYAHAAEYFVKVTKSKAADAKTRFRASYNAAVDYQKISAWADAAAMYDAIIKQFPDETPQSPVCLKAGFCLIQASQFEEALLYFEKAGVNPAPEDKPEILYWTATCYAKLGDLQKAITEYLKVPYLYSGIGKWGVTAEFEAGRLYERLGDYDRAQSIYRRIVKSDGEKGEFGKSALARLDQLKNLNAEASQ